MTIQPVDDGASISIGDLTVDSSADRIALHGSLDITRTVGFGACSDWRVRPRSA